MNSSRKLAVIVLGDNFNSEVYHSLRNCLINGGIDIYVAAINRDIELIDDHGNELIRPDFGLEDINNLNFDALILSDGSVSDDLRYSAEFQSLIRRAHNEGMIIATIDQSARYLIDAGIAKTHFLTASPNIRHELETHGAHYENEPVWVDGNFVSGRILDDLPAFCKVLVDEISLKPAA